MRRRVLKDLDRWRSEGEGVAVATLVRVSGSAPRLVGARLALTVSGRMSGSVSGGCVESDVMDRALGVLDSGKAELVTYGILDDDELGVGMHCGEIEVLIQPDMAAPVSRALSLALDEERQAVLATRLSPGRGLGLQMVITASGPTGSLGDGVDEGVKARAVALLGGAAEAGVESFAGIDGSVEVFVEVFARRPRLFIVGATHTAVPLCLLAGQLGFHVTVVDARKVFATEERFAGADEILRLWPDEAFGPDVLGQDSYVVTLTHDSKFDVPALACALGSEACYIGAMGSRTTHARRVEKLRERGFGDDDLSRIHAPVGLDIGARGPEEIALAILAEMLAVRSRRCGGPLSQRKAGIHDED